jgi:hypothetical protein
MVQLSLMRHHAQHAQQRNRVVAHYMAAAAAAVGDPAMLKTVAASLRKAEEATQKSSHLEMTGGAWTPAMLLRHMPPDRHRPVQLTAAGVGSSLKRRLRGAVRRALGGLGLRRSETAPALLAPQVGADVTTRPRPGGAGASGSTSTGHHFRGQIPLATGSDGNAPTGLAGVARMGPTEADCRLLLDALLEAAVAATGGSLRAEQTLRVKGLPISRADYVLRNAEGRVVATVEAKRKELQGAFAQCACQLLSLQALAPDAHTPIYGVISDGYRFSFLVLEGDQLGVHGPSILHADTWDDLYAIVGLLLACLDGTALRLVRSIAREGRVDKDAVSRVISKRGHGDPAEGNEGIIERQGNVPAAACADPAPSAAASQPQATRAALDRATGNGTRDRTRSPAPTILRLGGLSSKIHSPCRVSWHQFDGAGLARPLSSTTLHFSSGGFFSLISIFLFPCDVTSVSALQ